MNLQQMLQLSAVFTEQLQGKEKVTLTSNDVDRVHKQLKIILGLDPQNNVTVEDIEKEVKYLSRVCLPTGEIQWLCDHHKKSRKL